MYDLVIIGGGAASQSAAMYAIGKQINFLLICDRLGGRVDPVEPADRDYLVGNILVHFDTPDADEDEHHLIGSSVVHLFERQLKGARNQIMNDRAVLVRNVDDHFVIETERSGEVEAMTVIVATGAFPRRLEAQGANQRLITSLGYSTTHHRESMGGTSVAIVGETDQAVMSAAEFAQTAARVYLILPTRTDLGSADLAALQVCENIEILAGYRVREVYSENATRRLVIERGPEMVRLRVDAIFADLGSEPAINPVRHLVSCTPTGFIAVDERNATNVPGLFAAGDVTHAEGEQVLVAIGDGARAARNAHFYLLTRPQARQIGVLV